MGKKIKVTSCSGYEFEVDISDEACGQFGFQHGDRIYDDDARASGVIMGVARTDEWDNFGKKVLWRTFDCHGGRVTYNSGGNFKKETKERH